MALIFKRFQKYPELAYGFSEKKDGSMRLSGDSEKDAPVKERRNEHFSRQDITLEQLVSASLVHGVRVQKVGTENAGSIIAETDGLITGTPGIFLTVTGADCFPVYLYAPSSKAVGLIHVGWKGLLGGIVKNAVSAMREDFAVAPGALLAGIGPGIRVCHFEIKPESRGLYKDHPDSISIRGGKVFVDLALIIAKQLRESGVEHIEDSQLCTHCLQERYFSYRRDKPEVLEMMIAHIGVRAYYCDMKYDKLVRDNIPEIIRKKGETAVMHTADDAEYWQKLKEKLREEVDEFVKDESMGEIADVLEVLDAICRHKGFDKAELERVKAKKAQERGGFSRRIILEES